MRKIIIERLFLTAIIIFIGWLFYLGMGITLNGKKCCSHKYKVVCGDSIFYTNSAIKDTITGEVIVIIGNNKKVTVKDGLVIINSK